MASGTKIEHRSVTLLPIVKPRAEDNMASMFCGDILRVVSGYAEP